MRAYINKRLLAAASLVRDGAVLADVGTDHAYLPIYLLSSGKIEKAVLSDINEGPLSKAEENIRSAGLCDKAELILCDGAKALACRGITDYAICGMGGELIANIIDEAPQLRDGNIRMILQPMSKPEALRAYLFDNGFSIEREIYVTDEGKHYVCILACFSGKNTEFSLSDAYFGEMRHFASDDNGARLSYMKDKYSSLLRTIDGKRCGGLDSSREEELLEALKKRLNKL